jgi:hypothetical protein
LEAAQLVVIGFALGLCLLLCLHLWSETRIVRLCTFSEYVAYARLLGHHREAESEVASRLERLAADHRRWLVVAVLALVAAPIMLGGFALLVQAGRAGAPAQFVTMVGIVALWLALSVVAVLQYRFVRELKAQIESTAKS